MPIQTSDSFPNSERDDDSSLAPTKVRGTAFGTAVGGSGHLLGPETSAYATISTEFAEEFWRDYFAQLSRPTPLPHVTGTLGTTDATEYVRLEMSSSEIAACWGFCREHETRVEILLAAAWAILLNRYSGDAEVVFGVPAGAVGDLVPVSVAFSSDAKLRDIVTQVAASCELIAKHDLSIGEPLRKMLRNVQVAAPLNWGIRWRREVGDSDVGVEGAVREFGAVLVLDCDTRHGDLDIQLAYN
ncbi:MAG: hypothetical protein KDB23_14070, partial [Planctomycetales bacterium]|nr:hypothetical protein [Planctomycetales bacterium]